MAEGSTGERLLWSAWTALVLCVAPLRAESRRALPTFGAGVEVVNLDLAVTDTRDRPVSNLTGSDLAVFEDGVPQELCIFTQERLPLSLSILIDGSASMGPRIAVAQAAALRLIRALGPTDEAQVAQFTRRLSVLQDFTSDRGRLEAAVGRVVAEGETSLYAALYIALKELVAGRRPGEDRRRAIVVLTDGEDTSSIVTEEQLLDLGRRSEVAVYAIGLRGAPTPLASTVPVFFLTTLARETGGRAWFPRAPGELDGVYGRIGEELRTLYGVGYVSGNPRRDGKWRAIAVRVLRANLLVRHRPGYYGPGTGERRAFRSVAEQP